MKYNFLIAVILICGITSCDGKHRAVETHEDKLKNSNLSESFFENIEYIPKDYTEVKTDTLLSNGFSINLKFYSDMATNVVQMIKADTINYKRYYRNFNAELVVKKDKVQIFSKIITNSFVVHELSINKDTLNNFVFSDFWIDELKSIRQNKALINLRFCNPETENCKTYLLTILDNKSYNLETLLDKES